MLKNQIPLAHFLNSSAARPSLKMFEILILDQVAKDVKSIIEGNMQGVSDFCFIVQHKCLVTLMRVIKNLRDNFLTRGP